LPRVLGELTVFQVASWYSASVSVDGEHLFRLARDKTVAGRRALVATVGDLFFDRREALSDRERALMTEILRQLIHDVEIEVRQALAHRLARERSAPTDLVVLLANDRIEVAHPILLHSEVLDDDELIEIVHHRTLEHQLAIAMRREVSERVADVLVERGDAGVIKALLENRQARISQAALAYLVEESKRVDTYQNPLLRRAELGPVLARRMYGWVSAALRRYILENFSIDPRTLDGHLDETTERLARREARPGAAETLAAELSAGEAITPALLIDTLRHGEVALFQAMFAKFTGLPALLVRRLVFEPGGEGLAIACRAAGIDAAGFTSIFVLSRKARHDSALAPGEVTRIVAFFSKVRPEHARRLLQNWHSGGGHLKRIAEPESTAPPHGP
jgi:uncharacterized protein (DUF2336 family)